MGTITGRLAENAVAVFLSRRSHAIITRNWRTRWCEIDLITKRASSIYFVEVKYRHSSAQGRGLDYITRRKREQMRYAAERWLCEYDGRRTDFYLSAAEVSGPSFAITAWIPDID